MVRAYDNNEVAAGQKYEGKRVSVAGVIESVGRDILDDPYVSLEADGYFWNVQCMFPESAASRLATLSKGQSVTLAGTVSGKFMNVLMRDCEIR